ncbi:hypothetical protein SAMN05216266_106243 [Amycolatopsis marina]|uniref:Uncharacterized protein n=1 Tax=Amycolatopsis marina TaxID=490629 RepID=A0A1I0Z9X0_9PSEU|nr:hypothetical protein SAMN05216266_106243 [Amycolatopsis marina]
MWLRTLSARDARPSRIPSPRGTAARPKHFPGKVRIRKLASLVMGLTSRTFPGKCGATGQGSRVARDSLAERSMIAAA